MLVERTPRSAARAPAAQAAAAQPIAEEPTAPTVEPVELLVDKDAMLEEMESMFEMAVVKVVCTALFCCAVLCCAVLCCAVLCCAVLCVGVCVHARARAIRVFGCLCVRDRYGRGYFVACCFASVVSPMLWIVMSVCAKASRTRARTRTHTHTRARQHTRFAHTLLCTVLATEPAGIPL